jgi:hypothetical protein
MHRVTVKRSVKAQHAETQVKKRVDKALASPCVDGNGCNTLSLWILI